MAEETKQQENKVEKSEKKKKTEVSAKFADLIKQIENLSVSELAQLVKELEERFGVSAAAPVAATVSTGGATGEAAQEEEKANYTIVLQGAGKKKSPSLKRFGKSDKI